jgi:hypothetical protein
MSFKTEQEAINDMKQNGCYSFRGMNCNDYPDDIQCSGWDGESYRCDCGNRRVNLCTEQRSDGTWFAYGQAY